MGRRNSQKMKEVVPLGDEVGRLRLEIRDSQWRSISHGPKTRI